jgi:hypothetical protein
VREAIGFSSMAQIASQAGVLSAMESMRAIEAALKGLPAWMKPLSTLQVLQPSWEIVSGLGAVGVGRPTLVQDIIGGLYAERAETVGFEAVVQMLQVADEAAEEEFAERVLQLLQRYSASFIPLLGQTTDWVQRQGRLVHWWRVIDRESIRIFRPNSLSSRPAKLTQRLLTASNSLRTHYPNLSRSRRGRTKASAF